jgi:ABC transporter substrate binding protein
MTVLVASDPRGQGAVGSGRRRLGPDGGPAPQRLSEMMEDYMRLARLTVPPTLALALLAAPLAARAQPTAGKVYRVWVLMPGGLLIRDSAFHQELREHGYVEGQNLVLEERGAEHRYERLPGLATELVQANVDIIFAATSSSARAAQQATQTIPIVFEVLSDPVAIGLVPNLARPGGNMTGVSGRLRAIATTEHEAAGGAQGGGSTAQAKWRSFRLGLGRPTE